MRVEHRKRLAVVKKKRRKDKMRLRSVACTIKLLGS